MSSSALQRFSVALLAFIGIAIFPAPLIARYFTDAEFRTCMQQAVNQRDSQIISATQTQNREIEAAMEARRAARMAAWGLENSDDTSDAVRVADRAFADRQRNAKKAFRDVERSAISTYSDVQRNCKSALRQRQTAQRHIEREARLPAPYYPPSSAPSYNNPPPNYSTIGQKCTGNHTCGTGMICTTSYGDCLSACDDPNAVCIQVCAGRCVPVM